MVANSQQKTHPFVEAIPKPFAVGNVRKSRRDISAIVRWPKNIQMQKRKAVLLTKLRIPPALNQFRFPINKLEAVTLFRFLAEYRPELVEEKRKRLFTEAEQRVAGAAPTTKKKISLKMGLDHVTKLVEDKKAKLVIIAHDVTPIELVCWLPTLCCKMNVPYCIVKGKARLGALVHQKNAAVVAIDEIHSKDNAKLQQLIDVFNPQFLNNLEIRRRWGN